MFRRVSSAERESVRMIMFLCGGELWRMHSRHEKMAANSADAIEKELRNRSAVVLESIEKVQLVLLRDWEPWVKEWM